MSSSPTRCQDSSERTNCTPLRVTRPWNGNAGAIMQRTGGIARRIAASSRPGFPRRRLSTFLKAITPSSASSMMA